MGQVTAKSRTLAVRTGFKWHVLFMACIVRGGYPCVWAGGSDRRDPGAASTGQLHVHRAAVQNISISANLLK